MVCYGNLLSVDGLQRAVQEVAQEFKKNLSLVIFKMFCQAQFKFCCTYKSIIYKYNSR